MDEEIDSDEAEGNSVEIFKAPVQVSQLQKKNATRNQLSKNLHIVLSVS